MQRSRFPTLSLGAAALVGLAASAPLSAGNLENSRLGGTGYVPNELVDQKVSEPLYAAENVFDVYRVIVDWLATTYPKEGDAGKAIAAFQELISKFEDRDPNEANPDSKGKVRTIEMPLPIDQLVRLLRAEAPGVSGPLSAAVKGNPKAQLVSSALLPFLQMRGITFRVRPIFEKSFSLHTMAINALRANRHELRYNARPNAMALFEFLTYPMAQQGRQPVVFESIEEVQSWIEAEVIPTLSTSIQMAEGALSQMSEGDFDSVSMVVSLLGETPFPDQGMEAPHRRYGRAEVQGYVGNLYAARAGLRALIAYDLAELGESMDKMTRWMMKSFLNEKIPFAGKGPRTGTPSSKRYEFMRKFSSLFTLKNGAQGPLILADLRKFWDHFEASTMALFNAQGGDDRVVRVRWLQASKKEFVQKVAPQVRAMLQGPASITDYIGGATVDVDLPGFLTSLPQDLKVFFPTQFDETTPLRLFRFSSGKLPYSNYDFGNPTGWSNQAAWRKLFPNISDAKGPEGHWIGPMRVYRDISRTYLGAIFGPALGAVMN